LNRKEGTVRMGSLETSVLLEPFVRILTFIYIPR
jgi:hypothetical protein